MKKIILILSTSLLLTISLIAQFPSSFKYQAVARDASGEVLADEPVSIEIKILQGNINGSVIYTEIHDSLTNGFGLISLNIGSGDPSNFQAIKWGEGPYFINISMNGVPMGTSELLSVPYALHAKTAESVENFSLSGNETAFEDWDKNGGDDFDGNYSSLLGAPTQVSSFNNDAGYLSSEADGSVTNEIQDISLSGTNLSISGGSTVNLSSVQDGYEANTDNQTLSLSDHSLHISGGNSVSLPDNVNDPDADPTNEIQQLSISGSTLFLSDGGSVELPEGSGFSGDYEELTNKPALVTSSGTFIGLGAGEHAVTIDRIVAVGNNTLSKNGEGVDPNSIFKGNNNTAVGYGALEDNTSGSYNLACGAGALGNNITGHNNTANGMAALYLNETGESNTASGHNALMCNISGSYNTANGSSALAENLTGSNNTAIGYFALTSNNSGNFNLANGHSAMGNNETGSYNTASGPFTLLLNKSGSYNTASGYNALSNSTTKSYLVAMGYQALCNNGKNSTLSYHATENTAIGSSALFNNTNGYRNTGIGFEALLSNTVGYRNTALGVNALSANTIGNFNTAVGSRTLRHNETGISNTAIGYDAGPGPGNTNLSNTTAIGNQAEVNQANKVRIGNTLVTVIEGQVAWSHPSDRRLKENINPCTLGLDFIKQVETVDYTLKSDENKKIQQGVIAQEVEEVCNKMGVEFSGINIPAREDAYYSVSYSTFVVPLINAVQELDKQNQILKDEMEKMQKDLEVLRNR